MEHPAPPPIEPVAFVLALILAPVLFTLCSFWLMFIPVVALVFGGPVYLVVGTPVLLALALWSPLTPRTCAKAAFGSVAVLTLVALAGNLAMQHQADDTGGILIFAAFAALFATVWGATFGNLYVWLTKAKTPFNPEGVPS